MTHQVDLSGRDTVPERGEAGGPAVVTVDAGGWFDRGRVRRAAGALLVLELLAFAVLIAGTHGWIVPLGGPTTTDFVSFYAAGKLAHAGTPALVYDRAAHLAAEERVAGAGIFYQYFNYPPVYLLLCAVLAVMPYLVAFVVFEGVTLALYLWVACRILGDRSGTALVALLAFPVVYWNMGLGQNAFLTAALFGAATLLVDRRPIAAGLLFGALCYKPQFGLLLPLALAAGGQWRTVAAAACSVAALVLLSLALFGAATWHAFLAAISASPVMYQSGRILFGGMVNSLGAARLLGAGPMLADAVQAAVGLVAALAVIIVWRRRLSLPTRAAVLAAATVVAAPLALLYDLMLGTVAALWLIRDRHAAAAANWEPAALAAFCVAAFLVPPQAAERWHLPVYAIIALVLFAMACRRAWRETAPRRAPAS